MKTTRLADFQQELRTTGAYRTHDDCRAANRARPGWWTTLYYSWGVTRVFPLCAIAEPLGRLDQARWAEFCFSTVTHAEHLGMNVIVEGFDHRLKVDGPVMYLCNHMSMTETILLPPILLAVRPLSYVAKASLAHLPLLAKAADHMGMVPVTRTSPRADLVNLLKVGTERIQVGNDFLIYPQGARCEVFSRAKYSSIGAKLAEKANCPIVPIVVDTRCQPTRKRGMLKKIFKDFGPVNPAYDIHVAFGPAIAPDRAKLMHEAAFDWMASKLSEWGLPVER